MKRIGGRKLPRSFYVRPTLVVARELLRKTIVFRRPDGPVAADIVEIEAYIGEDDPACHAAAGPTERNEIMYARGGYSYIYFIYGMYHCFNIVTERAGFPAAVLVRAVEPVAGEDLMRKSSPPTTRMLTNGPGKFCRAFGLSRAQNGLDLLGERLYIVDRGFTPVGIGVSARIGVKQGADRPWRFFDTESPFLSRI